MIGLSNIYVKQNKDCEIRLYTNLSEYEDGQLKVYTKEGIYTLELPNDVISVLAKLLLIKTTNSSKKSTVIEDFINGVIIDCEWHNIENIKKE